MDKTALELGKEWKLGCDLFKASASGSRTCRGTKFCQELCGRRAEKKALP